MGRVSIAEYVTWYLCGDEVIVINMQSGKRHALTRAATHVWCQLKDRPPLADLAESYADLHDLPRARALREVVEFLDVLREKQLIYEQRA